MKTVQCYDHRRRFLVAAAAIAVLPAMIAAQIPVVNSVNPPTARAGMTVTISGSGFNASPAPLAVHFGNMRATVLTATSDQISAIVPTGATYAPVSVTNTNVWSTGYSNQRFTTVFSSSTLLDGSYFNSRLDLGIGSGPFRVLVADLDADGRNDLIVGVSGFLNIFHNTSTDGSLSFDPRQDIVNNGTAMGMAVADLNGDGLLDIVTANENANVMSVFRNSSSVGSISFLPRTDVVTATDPRSVAVGDFDLDGKPDVAVVHGVGATVAVYRNVGGGGTVAFDAPVSFATGNSPEHLAVGDLDGDGRPDIATANMNNASPLCILRNTSAVGSISMAGYVGFASASSQGFSVALGDLDGDLQLDVVLTNHSTSHGSAWRNVSSPGNINLAARTDFIASLNPWDGALGDLNGDGRPDLAVANLSNSLYSLDRNTSVLGNISFASNTDVGTSAYPYYISVGDLDGDSKPEIVSTSQTDGVVSIHRNRVPPQTVLDPVAAGGWGEISLRWRPSDEPRFMRYRVYSGTSSPATTLTDSTSGRLDTSMTLTGFTTGDVRYLRVTVVDSNGTESPFSSEVNASPFRFTDVDAGLQGLYMGHAAWGDYDNDGDLDLVTIGHDGSSRGTRLYRNDAGAFSLVSAGLVDMEQGTAAWGDYDNDGDLDLLLTGLADAGPVTRLYRNDSGTFTDVAITMPGLYVSCGMWGDYDNDGDLDIFLAGFDLTDRMAKVFRNEGNGVFVDIGASLVGVSSAAAAWEDIDRDGDLDLLVTGWDGAAGVTKLYRNDGYDSFIDLLLPLAPVGYGSVAWGDYDNDGDPDLALTGFNGNGTTKIYRQDAGLTFTEIGVTFPENLQSASVAWGDVDSDGDLDLLLTGTTLGGNENRIYRNDGASSFTELIPAATEVRQGGGFWADYDNDSDLDFLLLGDDGAGPVTKLFRNDLNLANTAPNAPTGLQSSLSIVDATFRWNRASDLETPAPGLTYNLRVGTTTLGDERMSSHSNNATGYRRVVAHGNIGHDTAWTVRGLAPGTYWWSVQALDHNYSGSAFQAGGSFTVYGPPTITSISSTAGPVGSPVTITGDRFDPTASNNQVHFGAARAVVNASTSGTIDVTVPIGATHQPVTVTNMLTRLTGNAPTGYSVIFPSGRSIESSSFQSATTVGFGNNLREIILADLDNDGRVDVANVVEGIKAVAVMPNQSTVDHDSLGAAVWLSTNGYPFSLATADFDGDGRMDLVTTDSWLPGVAVFRNLSTAGAVSFAPRREFLSEASSYGVATGDVDGDGRMDLAVSNYSAASVSVLLNTTVGDSITFTDRINQGTAANPFGVLLRDLDADGRPELIIAVSSSNVVSVFRNLSTPGKQAFGPKQDFAVGSGARGLEAGDIDGDGRPDVIVTNQSGGSISVLRNTGETGSISFAPHITFTTGAAPVGVSLADFDGDGRLDVSVACGSGASVLRNISSPGSVSLEFHKVVATGLDPWSVAAGDLNGDQKPDIAVSHYNGQLVSVVRNLVKPESPQGLVATPGIGWATLRWRSIAENRFLRYRIYGGTSPNPTSVMDSTTGGKSDTSKILSNLTVNTTYYFRVTAVDSADVESEFSNEVSAPVRAPLAKIQQLVVRPSHGRVDLAWRPSPEDYALRYAIYQGGSTGLLMFVGMTAGRFDTVYAFNGLTNDSLYRYAVSAIDTAFYETGMSDTAYAVPTVEQGRGVSFDGVDGRLETEYRTAISFGGEATIEVWFKASSGTTGPVTIVHMEDGASPFRIGLTSEGRLETAVDLGGLMTASWTEPDLRDDRWHHAAAWVTGGSLQSMLDGGLSAVNTTGGSFVHDSARVVIGSRSSGLDPMIGMVDEVRIWRVARTADQLREGSVRPLRSFDPGLAAIYHFDEPSGGTAYSSIVEAPHAVFVGGAARSASGAMSPMAPLLGSATPASGSVTLLWKRNAESDMMRYRIYGGSSPIPTSVIDSVASTDSVLTVRSLINGTPYYFRVAAVDSAGNEGATSNELSAVPFPGSLCVAMTGDDGNDGSPLFPLRNIQTALTRANLSDTIKVAAGTYGEVLTTSKAVVLLGGFPSTFSEADRDLFDSRTIIDGVSTVMLTDQYASTVDGFIFNGTASVTDEQVRLYNGSVFSHNVVRAIYDAYATGVKTFGGATVVNNTLYNCYWGIDIWSGVGTPNIRNNIIEGGAYGVQTPYYTSAVRTYNNVHAAVQDYTSTDQNPGIGDISAAPVFRDPASNDFRIRESSPAVDAGDPSDPVGSEPAPFSSRIDMGAYGGSIHSPYLPPLPVPPTLVAPTNASTRVPRTVRLIWSRTAETSLYHLQLASDTGFASVVFDTTTADSSCLLTLPELGFKYYWRVAGIVTLGEGAFSSVNSFTATSGAVHVSTLGNDGNDGTAGSPFRTIQHAMLTMAPGDTVKVAAGTYAEGLVTQVPGHLRGSYTESFVESERHLYLHATRLQAVSYSILYDNQGVSIDGIQFEDPSSIADDLLDLRKPVTVSRSIFRNTKKTFAHAIEASAAIVVVNNTFHNCYYALYLNSTAAGSSVKNNVFSTNNYAWYNLAGDGLTSYNILFNSPRAGSYTAPGVGEISLDPLFLDAPGGKYLLSMSSPAVNAGDPTAAYNDPDGTRNDMGAFVLDWPPAPSSGLVAMAGSRTVNLTWRANSEPDVVGYYVYGGTSPSPSARIDSTIGGRTDTSAVIGALQNGTTYYFTVKAADRVGLVGGASNEVSATPDFTAFERDSLALVDLYNSTTGAGWTNKANWLTGPLDSWYGITLAEGRVSEISLDNNNLVGPIPESIGGLTAVWRLVIGNNHFTGGLPASIGQMSSLSVLIMWNSGLSGVLPSELANLSNLSQIYLQQNQLSGSIPAFLGDLSNLGVIELSNNQFTGAIPPELGALGALHDLLLGGNQVAGTIPVELGNLAQLRALDVRNNDLTGTLPQEIGRLTQLTYLLVQGNQLSGAVPDSVRRLTQLQYLYLSNNRFDHLPDLTPLTNLQSLDVAGNLFGFEDLEPNASVSPASFNYSPQDSVGTARDTTVIWKSNLFLMVPYSSPTTAYHWLHNGVEIGVGAGGVELPSVDSSMTGSYSWWSTNSLLPGLTLYGRPIQVRVEPTPLQRDSLALVDLYNATNGPAWTDRTNWLTGPVETWFGVTVTGGRVAEVVLSNNNLVGPIPASIGQLNAVWKLDLGYNHFSGGLPASIGQMSALSVLIMWATELSGPLPAELGNLPNLTQIYMQGNGISGVLPASLGALPALSVLELSGNQLTGPIPPELGAISTLTHLSLGNNLLTGTLPVELMNLLQLQSLNVQGNQLTGPVPSEIGRLTGLTHLFLQANQFAGAVPDSMRQLTMLQQLYLSSNQFDHLPDLSPLTSLVNLDVGGNRLSFADLEPNASVASGSFNAVPQDSIGVARDTVVLSGSTVILTATVDGTANQYQWYKDGSILPTGTSSMLTLNGVTAADNGQYVCAVTNTIVTGLTLTTRPIGLSVQPTLPGEYQTDANTVLLLHMNEASGTEVADASGNGNHGAVTGTTVITGRTGLSRNFISGDLISIPHSASLNVGAGDFTVEAWVKTTSTGVLRAILSKADATTLGVYLLADGKVNFYVNSGGASGDIVSSRAINDGLWHHVAGVRSGTQMFLYLDGLQAGLVNIPAVGSLDNTAPLTIGYAPTNIRYYGLVDEVRLSNVARAPQDFNLQLAPVALAGSVNASRQVTLTWQNGGGRAPLKQYNVYQGSDSASTVLYDPHDLSTSYTSPALTPGTYYWRITATDSTDFESAQSWAVKTVVTEDPTLVAYFPFNGNGLDESGYGHDGAYVNVGVAPDRFGVPGASFQFGTNSDFLVQNATISTTADYTICGWFSTDDTTKINQTLVYTSVWLSYKRGPQLDYYLNNPGGSGLFSGSQSFRQNQWYFFSISKQGSRFTAYSDDVEQFSVDLAGTTILPDERSIRIGSLGPAAETFSGALDDIRIYNRALSAAEVDSLYRLNGWAPSQPALPGEYVADANTVLLLHMNESSGSTVADASGSANSGTASGTNIVQGRFGSARSFNGTSDYLSIPDSPSLTLGNNDFTIELWLKYGAIPPQVALIGHDDGAGAQDKWVLWGGQAVELHTSAVTEPGRVIEKPYLPALDTWHHIAVTRTGDRFRLYADGAQLAESTMAVTFPDPSVPLTIGGAEGGYWFTGAIDEVRISNVARGPEEFNLQLTPANLTRTTLNPYSIQLNWENGGGAVPLMYYRVYRGADSTSMSELGATASAIWIDATVSPSWVYFYRVSAVDSTGYESPVSPAIRATTPGTSGLIAAYSFTGNALDESGYGNDADLTSNVLTTDRFGMAQHAVNIGGSYGVRVPNSPSLDTRAQVSMSVWVKLSAYPSNSANVVGKTGGDLPGDFSYMLYVTSTGQLRPHIQEADGNIINFDTPPISLNEWHHVVQVADGSTVQCYIDGVAMHATPPSYDGSIKSITGWLYAGYDTRTEAMNGDLDDIRIYNRGLSAAEVDSLYRLGGWSVAPPPLLGEYVSDQHTQFLWHLNEVDGMIVSDASGHGHDGLATGTTIASGRFGLARRISTIGDQIQTNYTAPFGTGAFTIELWSKLDDLQLANNFLLGNNVFQLSIYNDGAIRFFTLFGQHSTASGLVGQETWTHLAVTREPNGSVCIYKNGVPLYSVHLEGDFSGGNPLAMNSMHGLLDEIRISDVARLPQEFNLQLPPVSLAAVASGTTINLSWQNGGGAVGLLRYKIYRGADSTTVSLIDSTTGTAYSDAGLAQGATYFYRLTAVDSTGFEGAVSFASSATTTAATPPPGTPTLAGPADGTVYAPLSFMLSWNAVSGAETYRLQLASDAAFASIVRDSSGIVGTTLSIAGLTNSTAYFWRVSASNTAGTSSFSTSWSFTTIMAIPGVPTLASPSDGATDLTTSPTMTWHASSDAVSYHVQVATDAGFTTLVRNDSGITVTNHQTASLNFQSTYYWRVRAKNPAGVSDFSSAWSFTTTAAAPAAPVLAIPANDAIDLSLTPTLAWYPAERATSYRIQVAPISDFSSLNIDTQGLADTTFIIPNATLNSGQTYYWRVLAANAGGSSGFSGAWSFTTLPGLPEQVVLQSPSNGAVNRPLTLSLVWYSVATATSYRLQVSTVQNFDTIVFDTSGAFGNSMSVTGLTNGTTYYWRVQAANASGSGSYSTSWAFTTVFAPPEIPALIAPSNSTVDLPTTVNLIWRRSAGATSYDMVISTDASFATSFTSQADLTDTTFTVSGLAHSTTYYWKITAKNVSATATSGNWQFTTVVAPPEQVTLQSPGNGGTGIMIDGQVFQWGGVANATAYHLQIATVSDFTTTVLDDTTLTATSKQVGTLAPGILHYWRVRARNLGGYGPYSIAYTFTTAIAPPLQVTLASPTDGANDRPLNVQLSWSAAGGAESYDVQVSTEPTFGSTVFAPTGVTGTSVQASNLSHSVLYYWRVRGRNSSGAGPYSSTRTFTTVIAPPDPVVLVSPSNGAAATTTTLTMSWNAAARAATYDLEVASDFGFTNIRASAMGLTSTSHVVDNLLPLTQYFWRVRSNNAGGSAISSAWNFTTKPAAPAQPSLVTPLDGALDQPLQLALSWVASAGATGYDVQVATTNAFTPPFVHQSSPSGTSVTMLPGELSNLTTYYWRVRARNAYDTSAFSLPRQFRTIIEAPAMPSLSSPIAGAQNQSTSPRLTWFGPAPLTAAPSFYHLQVATSVNFLSGVQVDDSTLVDTSYTLSGLNINTTYYWRVRAKNAGGASPFSAGRVFTTVSAPPSPPSGITATAQQGRRIRLEWTPGSSNEENFRVERRNGGAFTEIANRPAGSMSEIDSLLFEGTTYTYRVRAYNAAGFSSYSAEASATTLDETAPTAPVSLAASVTGWTRVSPVTVTWIGPGDPSGIVKAWYSLNTPPTAGSPGTPVNLSGNMASIPITVQGAVTIYVYLEDGAGNRNVNAVSSTGVLFDSIPPEVVHDSNAVAAFNTSSPSSIAISATCSDGASGMKSTDLQYRRSGTTWSTGQSVAYPSITGGGANIPSAFLQANQSYGVDYRVIAEDAAGNRTITPTHSVRIVVGVVTERRDPQTGSALTQPSVNSLPASAPATYAYRMFSVPLDLVDKTPRDVFEVRTGLPAYNDEAWRFYKLKDNIGTNASDPFDEYPAFSSQSVLMPGRAFLLILRSGVVVKTGPGTVLRAEEYNKTGIALSAGYNFVGNPFAFDVPKDSLRLADGSSLTGKTAAFIGIGGEQSGWRLNPDTLKAWEGWVVKVSGATSLRFNIADRASTAVPDGWRAVAAEDPGTSWRIRVDAERADNGVVDIGNIAGIDGRASDGEDEFDMFEPPLIGAGALSVGFETEEGLSAYDVRSSREEQRAWDMVLRTPEPRVDVKLSFTGLDATGQPVTLFDLDSRTASRVENGEERIVNSRAGVRRFRLVVGSEAFAEEHSDGISLVPKATALHQNFPNPFNPATNLSFTVEKTGTATVSVFNVLGQEVTTLFNGTANAGRLYEVTFDARNLPSGVYFARLEAGTENRMVKMILAK